MYTGYHSVWIIECHIEEYSHVRRDDINMALCRRKLLLWAFCCYNRSPQNISRECNGVAEVHPFFLFLPLPPPLLSFSPPALLLIPLLSLPSFPPSLPPSFSSPCCILTLIEALPKRHPHTRTEIREICAPLSPPPTPNHSNFTLARDMLLGYPYNPSYLGPYMVTTTHTHRL